MQYSLLQMVSTLLVFTVSVFTRDDGRYMPVKLPSPYRDMDNIRFTLPGIEILLKNINQTKAADPDEFPARILTLKDTAKQISGVLSLIFQQSYEEGTIPSEWSTARISVPMSWAFNLSSNV